MIHSHAHASLAFPMRKGLETNSPYVSYETVSDLQADNENTITRLGTEKPQRPWHKSLDKLRR